MLIPKDEIWFQFSRSGGPGGQNVNKVNSKVTLRWNPSESKVLSEFQKQLLGSSELLKPFCALDGMINISCQESRSQSINRDIALTKLNELVVKALRPKKPRKKTKIPRKATEKRITHKKSRSTKLLQRRVPNE